jgi:hypothetical protein
MLAFLKLRSKCCSGKTLTRSWKQPTQTGRIDLLNRPVHQALVSLKRLVCYLVRDLLVHVPTEPARFQRGCARSVPLQFQPNIPWFRPFLCMFWPPIVHASASVSFSPTSLGFGRSYVCFGPQSCMLQRQFHSAPTFFFHAKCQVGLHLFVFCGKAASRTWFQRRGYKGLQTAPQSERSPEPFVVGC